MQPKKDGLIDMYSSNGCMLCQDKNRVKKLIYREPSLRNTTQKEADFVFHKIIARPYRFDTRVTNFRSTTDWLYMHICHLCICRLITIHVESNIVLLTQICLHMYVRKC